MRSRHAVRFGECRPTNAESAMVKNRNKTLDIDPGSMKRSMKGSLEALIDPMGIGPRVFENSYEKS